MDILSQVPDVKALVNITSDGLLNLNRVENQRVGFVIDQLPDTPPIFKMIKDHHPVDDAEMFEVYNMGVGFCVIASEPDVGAVLSVLERHDRKAWVIGKVIEDPHKIVHLPRQRLKGYKKRFYQE